MLGKYLKETIKILQDNNIDLSIINELLLSDEILLNYINGAKDKEDLDNKIRIILTIPVQEHVFTALDIYIKCSNKEIKSNVADILIRKELRNNDYNIILAQEYIDKPSKYVYMFINNTSFKKDVSLDLIQECISKIYNAKSDICADYIGGFFQIYFEKLSSKIEYATFKNFVKKLDLTSNPNILDLIGEFLKSLVKSKEDLDDLNQFFNILINSHKDIDDDIKFFIYGIYTFNSIFDDEGTIHNKNELVKLLLNKKVNREDFDLITYITKRFNYSNEIISFLNVVYNVSDDRKDYVILNKLYDNKKLYNYYCSEFYNIIKYAKPENNNFIEQLKNKLNSVLNFNYEQYAEKRKKKLHNIEKEKMAVIDNYLDLCDKWENDDINPSKLVRKK